MFNVGPLELVAIFVVALVVFGPEKLPEVDRQVARAVREVRKFQAFMEDSVRGVVEPLTGPIFAAGPTAGPPASTGTITGVSPIVGLSVSGPDQGPASKGLADSATRERRPDRQPGEASS